MYLCFLKSFLLLLIIFQCESLVKQDLGGQWLLENAEKGYKLNATVPGGIYTDLMNAKVIDDPFYGYNDINTRWVSKMDWNYSRTFTVSEDLFNHNTINLVFDGVDTFSKIYINNVLIDVTQNMFVRHIFDIKRHLKVGENTVQVNFMSPVLKAKDLFEEQKRNYTVVPLCVPNEYRGECHVNHIRKVQASFSWDWGPALPSVGIWKKVYIEAYNTTLLRDINIKTISHTSNDTWDISLYVYLAPNAQGSPIKGGDIKAHIQLDTSVKILAAKNISLEKNENGDHLIILQGSIKKSDVQLWWPNGYGAQNLYRVEVYYNSTSSETDSRSFDIGFRTIQLMEDRIKSGRKFYFKVNDIPIFAKGSNSIPINILPERSQNETTIRFLLQSAKDVHMNMIRVWGGGSYEADIFYELADKMGILIWQDFMFACNMYPSTEEFLSNVVSEVRHQVRRLQHHASIALWAGNNENEAALRQNWYGTGHNFELYKRDYKRLYAEAIQKELYISDDSRHYLVSSPTNGIESIKEDYVAEFPQSNFYGDVHFYNYNMDPWEASVYPICRFSSEYGYQGVPSINTLLTVTNNTDDLQIGSKFLDHRQHLPDGFHKMSLLLNYRLKLPDITNENYYKAYIYYSQIMQAMSVKITTEYNRQWRSVLNDEGKGYTMGSLIWQLNDVWVAPTWSGIDFQNNWKMMHYFIKHFYAPVIITGHLTEKGNLDIYVVSDLLTTIKDVSVTVFIYNWNSTEPTHNETFSITVDSNQSKKIKSLDVQEYFANFGKGSCKNQMKNCFLYFTFSKQNDEIAPNNFIFPVPLKVANIQKANVEIVNISNEAKHESHFNIEIKTDKVALFVWLEAKNIRGLFSDNGFLLVTQSRNITFIPEEPVEFSHFQKSLTISHLMMF